MANVQFQLVPVDYSRPYDEQPECKRHIIGAYANLARHNMTVTINTVMQAIGMNLFNENDIDDAFNKSHRKKIAKLDNIQKVNLQKRLYRHFPFFKRMKLEDENKKSVQLNTLLEVMADFTSCMAMLRNYYTHYHPYNSFSEQEKQFELKKRMGKRLQYLYENTAQLFKSNESLPHEANEVFATLRIPEDYVEEFMPGDEGYDELLKLITDPRTNSFKKKGLKLEMKSQKITRKSLRYVRNPEYQAYMMDDSKGMSDVAIIYFLCLFLEKKVAFELMEEVGFTKQVKFTGKNADQQLLFVKEIMCMNRIRMTKTKLDSEMTDTALALDMISELRKCPKPLYEVFCKEARDEFKDDATVSWERIHNEEAVATEETTEDENNGAESVDKNTPRSTFVRWEDRFPQMALRYIDCQGLFDDIRFQLNLGKYRFAFYQHDASYSVDNEERLRILQKELHGFGRIQEVNPQIKEKWATLFDEKYVEDGLTQKRPDQSGQAPYVTEQDAQYAIDDKSHSVGLRWEGFEATGDPHKHYGDLDAQKMFIPYLPTNLQKDTTKTNQAEPLLAPQAMLSLYELPALLFYQYLSVKYGRSKFEAENVIKDYYKNIRSFLDDFSKGQIHPIGGTPVRDVKKQEELWTQRKTELNEILQKYNLKDSDIPSKLRYYLCSKEVDYDQKLLDSALNRLNERKKRVEKSKESFNEKKKLIGTKQNKFDRMRATIKTGQLAQWLIRDIWDWLPNNSICRKKLSGQSYAVLQSSLAMLGQQFSETGVDILNVNRLKSMFTKAGVISQSGEIDKNQHHPFLNEVFSQCQIDSVEYFYETYLDCELTHIENVDKEIREGSDFDDYLKIPFLHCERRRWCEQDFNSLRNLAKRYLNRPIQLPDGLFAKSIFNLLLEAEPKLKVALMTIRGAANNQQLDNNTAYLIRLYMEEVEGDHSQPFYSTAPIDGAPSPYRHVYRLFKKYFGQPIPGTNQTTTPAYTIEEIREILKDKSKLMELILNHIADDLAKFREKKKKKVKSFNLKAFIDLQWKIVKDENATGKAKRNFQQRKQEVDKRINAKKKELEGLRAKIEKEVDEYEKKLIQKQKRQFDKVADNERIIRRFKTQDVLMFVMAREILKAKSKDRDFTKGFCLKYVMTDSLLSKPIDFDWRVNIKEKDKKPVTKTIRQEGMKMKNYGQFYKFASDHQRLESLLSRLPGEIFLRAEIENEFSYYDTNRSEVFRQVYIIESEAYRLKPELLDDSNANEGWFYYSDNRTGKQRPIRNSFIQLLEILAAGKDGILDDNEKVAMQTTRNAFGHNTYDVDLDAVFEGNEQKKKIPEVSNGITSKIKEGTTELKKKLEE